MILSRGKALCREIRSCNGRIKKDMEPFAKSRPKSPAHKNSHRKMCQPKVNCRINTFQNLEKEAQRYENGWLLDGGK